VKAGGRVFPTGIAGLGATVAVLALAMLAGGNGAALLNPVALALVAVATCTATLAAADPAEARELTAWLRRGRGALPPDDPGARIRELVSFLARLRRRPPRELEAEAARLDRASVLAQGLGFLLEGRETGELARLLAVAVEAAGRGPEIAARLAARAGETAPAMGLVGTLLGLVDMLGRLREPDQIGPGLALALLTTLYGALLAHVAFLPLARRLTLLAERARTAAQLEAETVLALARDEHPDLLAGRLAALAGLPPAGVFTDR